jgi:hypothetical protein
VGCVAAQVALLLGVADGARGALGAGLKVALGLWALGTGWRVLRAVAEGRRDVLSHQQREGSNQEREDLFLARWPAWQIALAGGALVAIGLQRSPGRMALSLLAYGLLAAFAIWVAQDRGGRVAGAQAAALVALFAVVSTGADRRVAPPVETTRQGSPFRWSVGWPDGAWVLRHELQLQPGAPGPKVLLVPLAEAYDGPAQVLARVNGVDLGALEREQRTRLRLVLPERGLVGSDGRLTVELRQQPYDPHLRLIAQRWTSGASLGARASSYFDGRSWRQGTFEDATGRALSGVYVIQFGDDL